MPSSRSQRSAPHAPLPTPFVGALLRTCWQVIRRDMNDAVHAAGFLDVQDAHLTIFQYPGPDGLRPSELARQVRMSRQATNYLIAQLEDRGYLERRTTTDTDQRRVHVTPRGRDLIAAIRAFVQRVEDDWARKVGRRRFAEFIDVLRLLASVPGAPDAGAHRRPSASQG